MSQLALKQSAYLESDAAISPNGAYRYWLLRRWAPGHPLVFVMLNPSTADAAEDDPTIRRCVGFARALGFGAVEIGNLGALRATSPKVFHGAAVPIGPNNDSHLLAMLGRAGMVIAAWGALPKIPWLRERARVVTELITRHWDLHALRVTAEGFPSHPLYLPGDLKPVLYRARRSPAAFTQQGEG